MPEKKPKRKLDSGTKCAIILLFLFIVFTAYTRIEKAMKTEPTPAAPVKKIALDKKPTEPDFSLARDYTVLSGSDFSIHHPRRTRKQFVIFSADANTFDERAQTVAAAALQLQKKYRCDYALVMMAAIKELDIGVFNTIARADYSPDGKGGGTHGKVWDITASPNEIDDTEIYIIKMWEKAIYEKSLDNIDEIAAEVATRIGTTPEKISAIYFPAVDKIHMHKPYHLM